ncbi:hypothetical protein SBRCBS47491_001218 [Sporothrix bragantina]|uniref:Aflatoxin regulatory protein domain-containing protein n=1 Tax=Sporothrix bragantina TaxID=671064 RepID=A0ABP0AWV1_9PEZI
MSALAAGFSPMTDDRSGLLYAAAVSGMTGPPGLYRLDTGWQTPSLMDAAPGGAITRNHSISSELALLAMDENAAAMAAAAANGDLYATGAVPWTTPPTDLSASQFSDSPISSNMPVHTAEAQGHLNMAAATNSTTSAGIPWMDPSVIEMFQYGQGQPVQGHGQGQTHQQQQQQQMHTPGSIASSSANNYFPSPSTTPSLRQSPATGHKSVPLSNSGNNGNGSYYQSHIGQQHSQVHANNGSHINVNVHLASCACFTSCLQALQALHNASTPAAPPFDVVLSLNRNAVEGCAAMLACPRCMGRSGTHTAAMLLATLLGKITSFYKTASQSYFHANAEAITQTGHGNNSSIVKAQAESPGLANTMGPAASRPAANLTSSTSPSVRPSRAASIIACAGGSVPGLGVSLGGYQLQDEDGRWLELEILHRELKKLEEVYARFREVCGEVLFEDVAVSKAMIGYLGQTLGATLDLVNHRKGELQFV